jgi:hypothetical protein
MADGVSITSGAGTTILTDDTGAGGHAQVVKLAISTDGSGTLIPAEATNGLDVDVTRVQGTVAVSNAGTFATQVDGAALTALQLIDDSVVADDAAFTLGTSKVTLAGAYAVAHGSAPDAADAGDAVAMLTNRHRIPFILGGHPNLVTTRVTYAASAQTDVSLTGTQAGGTKVVVTQVQVTVSNPTTATPSVVIGFGATNTPTGAGVVLSHPGIPGGGGVSRGDGSGILGIGADGEELRITAGAATGGVLDCVVSYFLIES